jgi:hypothetical protein
MKEFPPLIFYIKSENITFEFTYKDLFKKINDKYYFLIIFERFVSGYWRFGKPFYKKYTFVYNGDAKTIGFYLDKNILDDYNDKNQDGEKNNNKDWKLELSTLKIVIIIVLLMIFISLVIIISYFAGKKCNEKRKRYANELDDDNFVYTINNSNS